MSCLCHTDDMIQAIMLAKFKLSLPEIRKALLEINDAVFTMDDLKIISKQLPTVEEVSHINISSPSPSMTPLARSTESKILAMLVS